MLKFLNFKDLKALYLRKEYWFGFDLVFQNLASGQSSVCSEN